VCPLQQQQQQHLTVCQCSSGSSSTAAGGHAHSNLSAGLLPEDALQLQRGFCFCCIQEGGSSGRVAGVAFGGKRGSQLCNLQPFV
jgi:hypothetical protein